MRVWSWVAFAIAFKAVRSLSSLIGNAESPTPSRFELICVRCWDVLLLSLYITWPNFKPLANEWCTRAGFFLLSLCVVCYMCPLSNAADTRMSQNPVSAQRHRRMSSHVRNKLRTHTHKHTSTHSKPSPLNTRGGGTFIMGTHARTILHSSHLFAHETRELERVQKRSEDSPARQLTNARPFVMCAMNTVERYGG